MNSPSSYLDRFEAKIEPEPMSGCWLWAGAWNAFGYGYFWRNGREDRAHRVAYELYVGDIPAGKEIDHLCRVRACVNPAHLEPVTGRENKLRSPFTLAGRFAAKTHCPQGHIYDTSNTYVRRNGGRACRICARLRREQGV